MGRPPVARDFNPGRRVAANPPTAAPAPASAHRSSPPRRTGCGRSHTPGRCRSAPGASGISEAAIGSEVPVSRHSPSLPGFRPREISLRPAGGCLRPPDRRYPLVSPRFRPAILRPRPPVFRPIPPVGGHRPLIPRVRPPMGSAAPSVGTTEIVQGSHEKPEGDAAPPEGDTASSVGDDSPPEGDTGVAQGRLEKPEGGTAPLKGASSPPEGASGEPEGKLADLISTRSFLLPGTARVKAVSRRKQGGEPPAASCTSGFLAPNGELVLQAPASMATR